MKIIKGQFGPKQPTSGNPNPGDPKQPSPPTFQGVDPAKPGSDRTGMAIKDMTTGEMIPLSPDQEKAIGLILSGITFVFLGIKPAATGADFFTALHGDHSDLRQAEDELPNVIHRLYVKKGVVQ